MTQPTLERFADTLYGTLAPLAWQDEEQDWALANLSGAIGSMFQEVDTLAEDTPAGEVGWSMVVDLDRCPTGWLDWLAQFVGVTLLPNTTDAEKRFRIASTDGFRRGTPAALRAAAQAQLTGDKTVVFRERHGSAYQLQVITYTDQTPDEYAVLKALLAQKPGGIVLDYHVLDGQDYESLLNQVFANYIDLLVEYETYTALKLVHYNETPTTTSATYATVFAEYPTYTDLRLGQ